MCVYVACVFAFVCVFMFHYGPKQIDSIRDECVSSLVLQAAVVL